MAQNRPVNPFQPARKMKSKLRFLLTGPSGSGKTWLALDIATRLAELEGGKVALIDTEGGSAALYASHFDFDVLVLKNNYSPDAYVDAMVAAVNNGYSVLIVDSWSHAWNGAGGVLEIVDKAGKKMSGNDFAGWSEGRPKQNRMVGSILNIPIHLIGTARAKTVWSIETDPKSGKTKPSKVGEGSVQSSEFEYEFTFGAMLDMEHRLHITKVRGPVLQIDDVITDIGDMVSRIQNWMVDGEEPPAPEPSAPEPQPPAQPKTQPSSPNGQPNGWANADNLLTLGTHVSKHIVDSGFVGTDDERNALVVEHITYATGIVFDRSNRDTYAEWNAKYPTGKAALEAIKAAYDKPSFDEGTAGTVEPPEEPIAELTEGDWAELDRWTWETFGRDARVVARLLDLPQVDKGGFRDMAWIMAITHNDPLPMVITEIKRDKKNIIAKLPHGGKTLAVPESKITWTMNTDDWQVFLLGELKDFERAPEPFYVQARMKSNKWTVLNIMRDLEDPETVDDYNLSDDPETEADKS